jgi:fucose 4-O-acetylase-like acetyltransferase
MAAQKQLSWPEYAKGIGIVLVVLGHIFDSLMRGGIIPSDPIFGPAYEWIYTFHMPLFFALSGLFVHKLCQRGLRPFGEKVLRSIVYPYLVWSALQTVVQIVMSRHTNSVVGWDALFAILYQPVMQFWFLYTLMILFLFYFASFVGFGHRAPVAFLVASIGVFGLVCCRVNLGSWSVIYQVALMSVYFGAGTLLGQHLESMPSLIGRHRMASVLFVFLTAVAVTVGSRAGVRENLPLSLPFAAAGSAGVIVAAVLLSQRAGGAGPSEIRRWGAFSLEIFVAHTLFMAGFRIFAQRVLHLENPYLHLVGGTLVGVYGPIFLATTIQRLHIDFVFRLRDHGAILRQRTLAS